VLPPTGVTAIVAMDNPAEARAAFKSLAYAQHQKKPLYLEWAPEDVFDQTQKEKDEARVKREKEEKLAEKRLKKERKEAKEEEEQEVEVKQEPGEDVAQEEQPPEPETTIFVKNLNFDTTDETLLEVSEKLICLLLKYFIRSEKNDHSILSLVSQS
jgi:multiple RNA-binding domain-containing protein 1